MTFSNLATVVEARTYARPVGNGKIELPEQTVERYVLGNVKDHNVSEEEINKLLYFGRTRKAGPGGRGLWYSGSSSHEKIGGVALNNCLEYETEIVTSHGIRAIGDLAGQTVTVLDGNGKWIDAPIRSFGKQKLQKITAAYGRITKEIFATPEHLWYIVRDDSRVPCITASLKPGDALASITGNGIKGIRPSPFGVAQGFVFGDGTSAPGRASGKVVLCGDKDKALLKYFSLCSTRETEAGIEVSDLPNRWKRVPSIGYESKSFLYGWLAGYFAADGSVKEDGQIRLASTSEANLYFVRDLCAVLGIKCHPVTKQERVSNLTDKDSTLYSVTLNGATLTEDFFVIDEHRKRFTSHEYRERLKWKVVSVEDTDREEEVFCAVVDTTHSFALADNILTGNCWFLTSEEWKNFVIAMDLLMLGGGVGLSIEHRFVSKLPKVRKDVEIRHVSSKDADFIVPDSREGWCKLFAKVLEAFFVTGKGFTYSTICIRGAGEAIAGFGGTASGPMPLIEFIENLKQIIGSRAGKFIRPIDAMDIICATGKMVVAGNVRRSAIIILGDPFDKEYLTAKRWDLHPIPPYRQNANLSVVVDEIEDLHPLFWKTYEHGEPFGLINRKNIQTYGRMGEKKKDTAVGVNPCGEATLEPFEPCNLTEIALPNLRDENEFEEAARLMHRYAKRVTMERYHHEEVERVIKKNRRVGTSVTGCLRSPLWVPQTLDRVYQAIQAEDVLYSNELGVPLSIRTTLNKPSGTWSKRADMLGYEGLHAPLSRYMIQRVQFGASDKLLPLLREAGHTIEPKVNIDGSLDHAQQVVDFYVEAPEGYPLVDEGFDTWKQLDQVLLAQKWWSDQSVSVTVYYKVEEIGQIKEWLANNFKYLKTISFLLESGHGFRQAPKEPISAELYEKLTKKIKPLDVSRITEGGDISSQECAEGYCPVK